MDKNDIDVSLAKRLIRSQFPQWADMPVERVRVDGHDNRTFHLGERMSIRLPTGEAYADHVPIEHKWLPQIAEQLVIPITKPIAEGSPDCGYPWQWSVNRWIPGETASHQNIKHLPSFAEALAEFLNALQSIDANEAPPPGPENFFRGGSLAVYDSETREAIGKLSRRIDSDAAIAIWETSLAAKFSGPNVWIHGDVSPGNLIVSDGMLGGVIDFGQLAAGDPSCDLAIAWTFFSGDSREVFRESLAADASAWIRGRGWALWKALITCESSRPELATTAKATLEELFKDFKKHNKQGG